MLNISYRDIYDVLFKVFFYAKNGWISQKNLIYATYLQFLNKMSKRVPGVIFSAFDVISEKMCDVFDVALYCTNTVRDVITISI
jgi:hypothetical protein